MRPEIAALQRAVHAATSLEQVRAIVDLFVTIDARQPGLSEAPPSQFDRALHCAFNRRCTEDMLIAIRHRPWAEQSTIEELEKKIYEDMASSAGARAADIRAYVYLRDGLTCRICNRSIRAGRQVIDHILPICMNGDNDPYNLRVTHRFCNNSRGPHRHAGREPVLHDDEYVRKSHEASISLRFKNVVEDLG